MDTCTLMDGGECAKSRNRTAMLRRVGARSLQNAEILNNHAAARNGTTGYDPACGSRSLLLNIGNAARHGGKDLKETIAPTGQSK